MSCPVCKNDSYQLLESGHRVCTNPNCNNTYYIGPSIKTFTVYHGTASYELDSFLSSKPRIRLHRHIQRECFCTSKKLEEAAFFALRKTPANDLNKTGIVIEFECKDMVYKKDYERVKDSRAIRNEREIAVYNTDKMIVIAFWHFENGWKRETPKLERCSS